MQDPEANFQKKLFESHKNRIARVLSFNSQGSASQELKPEKKTLFLWTLMYLRCRVLRFNTCFLGVQSIFLGGVHAKAVPWVLKLWTLIFLAQGSRFQTLGYFDSQRGVCNSSTQGFGFQDRGYCNTTPRIHDFNLQGSEFQSLGCRDSTPRYSIPACRVHCTKH